MLTQNIEFVPTGKSLVTRFIEPPRHVRIRCLKQVVAMYAYLTTHDTHKGTELHVIGDMIDLKDFWAAYDSEYQKNFKKVLTFS